MPSVDARADRALSPRERRADRHIQAIIDRRAEKRLLHEPGRVIGFGSKRYRVGPHGEHRRLR